MFFLSTSCGLDGLIIHYDVEKANNAGEGQSILYGHESSVFRISLNPCNDALLLSAR